MGVKRSLLLCLVIILSFPVLVGCQGEEELEFETIEKVIMLYGGLDKFEEDVLRKPTAAIRGTRRAVISFGEPIPVEPGKSGKPEIHALTERLEQSVQTLLDNIQLE